MDHAKGLGEGIFDLPVMHPEGQAEMAYINGMSPAQISIKQIFCKNISAMSLEPMPFLSGPVASNAGPHEHRDPPSDIVSVIPLSKVQQALWLDYLVRPHVSHYHLRLEIDVSYLNPSLEKILQGEYVYV